MLANPSESARCGFVYYNKYEGAEDFFSRAFLKLVGASSREPREEPEGRLGGSRTDKRARGPP